MTMKEKMEKMGLDFYVTKSDNLKELGFMLMTIIAGLKEEEEKVVMIVDSETKETIFTPKEDWKKFLNEKNL